MSLNLIGSEGLFTRLGHLIYALDGVVNQYRGTDLAARIEVIQTDYSATDQNLVNAIYTQLSSGQVAPAPMASYFRTLAQNTVTQMVNEFAPQRQYNYVTALRYLFNYLVSNSQSVVRNTVSAASVAGGSNVGNGVILAGTKNNLGFPLEQMIQEVVTVKVVRDVRGGAISGQESLQFNGTFGTTDMLNWLWPQGSNATATTIAITPATSGSNSTRNWLTNGMMESFTSNVPANWHIVTGTAGTTILQDTVTFYDGVSSLQFVGNGSELTGVKTQFGVDFSGNVNINDQLAVNLFYKLGSSAAAGVLKVSLVDGSGTILQDASSVDSSFSVSLVGVNTAWHALSGFLRTPSVLPTQVYLKIALSTALTTSVTLNLDRISLARPATFYTGGPPLACFSGNVNWTIGDTYALTVSNAYNGLIQSGCNKLLNLSGNGLILPSVASGETISDSLVI